MEKINFKEGETNRAVIEAFDFILTQFNLEEQRSTSDIFTQKKPYQKPESGVLPNIDYCYPAQRLFDATKELSLADLIRVAPAPAESKIMLTLPHSGSLFPSELYQKLTPEGKNEVFRFVEHFGSLGFGRYPIGIVSAGLSQAFVNLNRGLQSGVSPYASLLSMVARTSGATAQMYQNEPDLESHSSFIKLYYLLYYVSIFQNISKMQTNSPLCLHMHGAVYHIDNFLDGIKIPWPQRGVDRLSGRTAKQTPAIMLMGGNEGSCSNETINKLAALISKIDLRFNLINNILQSY